MVIKKIYLNFRKVCDYEYIGNMTNIINDLKKLLFSFFFLTYDSVSECECKYNNYNVI